MGEATPAQSAAGPFVPMLGVGLGSLPGGVGVGAGPVVAPARGSAVPQLHNAIVERLRARIELCRRHHSTCENRYQRSQAETSDREHENTLHLLNIVHQGPGNRKSKGSRGSNQQPPEYSRANGERKGSEGEPKISTRIALQGSLRRKIEGHAPGGGHKQNGLSCGFSGSDFKRVCLDGGALGRGPCGHNPAQPHPLPSAPSSMDAQRKGYPLQHGVGQDVFNMTLRDMKKEPSEVPSCGRSGPELMFDFKDEGGGSGAGQIDPELQDLFDELTKTVPTLNDLELERMLKQDDAFGLDLGRPNSAGPAGTGALCCASMERPIKMEPSPDFGQVQCALPQLRPASAGPSFSASPASAAQKAPPLAPPPRPAMPCWPEISRAEQLKQMAANQQQPGSLLHHQHPAAPPAGLSSWAPGLTAHSAPSPSSTSANANFPQDKVSGPAAGGGQRMGSQNKGISSNCLFKTNGHVDMKVLSTKPMLHFSPKAAGSQPMSAMVKMTTAQQQQQQSKSQPHPALHFQNQQGSSTSGPPCLQAKQPTGLPFKASQPRQGVPPGPRLPVMSGQLQLQAPGSQQKAPAKSPAMARQLNQPHPAISNAEKDNNHEQFSRHLIRPPPDYKQSRGIVGVQQGSVFTGQNPVQSPTNVAANDLQSMSCRSASQLSPSPSDRRFAVAHPTSCLGQFQQHNSGPNRLVGLNPNKARFLGPSQQGGSFGMSVNSSGAATAGLGGLMRNVGWAPSSKQGPGGPRRPPVPLQSQGASLDIPNHLYQQRHIGPPNQVAPDLGLLPHNPSTRPGQPMMGSPTAVGNLSQASPEQRVPAGSYSGPSPSSYHSNRANHLTFDFLPEGDNTVPGINTDSDFIDSLLKSGSGNDDWMKDINLDEILGGHT